MNHNLTSSTNNIDILNKRFPYIQLQSIKSISYFNPKNSTDYIYQAIPELDLCLIWITYFQDKHIAYQLSLDDKNNINSIKKITMAFNNKLSDGSGTLLQGGIININKQSIFIILNIHYYSGLYISKLSYDKKIPYIHTLFKTDLSQTILAPFIIIPVLPYFDTNIITFYNTVRNLLYDIKSIYIYNPRANHPIYKLKYNSKQSYTRLIFKVKACIEPDIYYLYLYKSEQPYTVACINTFSDSIKLNKLFRKIRENTNLDLLEESDDEDDFENIDSLKYVDIDKSYDMECVYIYRFKSWLPIKLAKGKYKIANYKDINLFNKNMI